MDLQFMKGRGFLSATDVGIDDRLTVELLRMEIPDLSFPFDAGGGVGRFRDDRCLVREASLRVDETSIEGFLSQATQSLDGFDHPSCTVEDGVAHLSVEVAGHREGVPISFKAALVTPEGSRGDGVFLTLFDYRAYGPLTASIRRLARTWITQLLEATDVDLPSPGSPYPLEIAGDILTLRPLKWLLLSLFPARGWKVPGTEGIEVSSVAMADGAVRLAFEDAGAETSGDSSRWSRRALAAHEAKDTFARVDEAVFSGDVQRGLEILEAMEGDYGSHRSWIARRIDLLMEDPTAPALAEARSLTETLQRQSDRGVLAGVMRANLAWISEGPEAAAEAFQHLLEGLEGADDVDPVDHALVSQALGDLLADERPEAAVTHLESALERAPSRVGLLRRLASLYRRLDRHGDLEVALRRLAGRVEAPDLRHEVLVELGQLLVGRSDEEGEGRRWLQKALKLRPNDRAALQALGESYARSGDPLRAAKTLGQAARSAHDEADDTAADLHRRVARLWLEDLDDADQAHMHAQRAMEIDGGGLEYRVLTAELCQARGDKEAAVTHWTEVLGECEQTRRPSESTREMRLRAHRHLADLLERLGQQDRAERHRRELGDDEQRDDEEGEAPDLSAFRNRYEKLVSERPETAPGKRSAPEESETPKPTPQRLATEDAIDLDRLDALREEEHPAALADALEEAIGAWERTGDDAISRERWLRWHRELGELAYLELEEVERARRALEPLREFDPDGLGRDETVLRLLESIYEETGDVDGKTRILQARIESADSAEMVRTLKVLIAQTTWEERQSAEEARPHLREVLEDAPEHRGAHRLLAKMAEAEGRWDDVVDHLEAVVEASKGGLDEVEVRRRLADILVEQCEDPQRARAHFRKVVEASPGDTRAIEGLKACQRQLEQWEELLDVIAHQIGVLTGAEDIVEVERFGELVPDALDDDTAMEVSRYLTEAAEIAAEHLSDLRSAQSWAGRALAMWDGNIEALELRISIDRILQDHRALARDLVRQANALLDSQRRYEALLEAAEICIDELNAPGSTRRLLARCLQEDHAEHADPQAVQALQRKLEAHAQDTSSTE
jgi:tetratricopeptide (TPR) repeat protein